MSIPIAPGAGSEFDTAFSSREEMEEFMNLHSESRDMGQHAKLIFDTLKIDNFAKLAQKFPSPEAYVEYLGLGVIHGTALGTFISDHKSVSCPLRNSP